MVQIILINSHTSKNGNITYIFIERNHMKYKNLLLTLIISVIIFPSIANAYLDAGTGSYILQLLLAAFFGGLFAIKLFWNKIKTIFKNLFSGKKDKNIEN